MRAIWYACFVYILVQVLPGCKKEELPPPPPSGVAVESKDGKFSVILPDSFPQPEVSSKQVPTEVGEITMHLYSSDKPDGSTFIISYNDYPENAFVKETPKMMDDIRDGALGNLGATLEGQNDFSFEGYPARSLDFSIASEGYQGYGRLQYFIAKPRLYQVIFLASDRAVRDLEVIRKTFASFKLLK
ncbi:MAG TPA: hypothetical protein VJ508_04080 [Saprospiraceae bacterium]|nr:hypothetical protein [Saprospiraceae bacterium]